MLFRADRLEITFARAKPREIRIWSIVEFNRGMPVKLLEFVHQHPLKMGFNSIYHLGDWKMLGPNRAARFTAH